MPYKDSEGYKSNDLVDRRMISVSLAGTRIPLVELGKAPRIRITI